MNAARRRGQPQLVERWIEGTIAETVVDDVEKRETGNDDDAWEGRGIVGLLIARHGRAAEWHARAGSDCGGGVSRELDCDSAGSLESFENLKNNRFRRLDLSCPVRQPPYARRNQSLLSVANSSQVLFLPRPGSELETFDNCSLPSTSMILSA